MSSADGSEVRDTSASAQLVWRRCVEGMSWDGTTCVGVAIRFTQQQALQHAQKLTAMTGLGWRVPSVKEQNGLVQREIETPP